MILSEIITRLLAPFSQQSMLKNLAGNTSGSFVNTLCIIEIGGGGGGGGQGGGGGMGDLKVIFQFSLAKLICSNIFDQD